MELDKKVEVVESRRAFMKTAAQVAVTAPAVAMLLSATTKPASAAISYDDAGPGGLGGDLCHSGALPADFTNGCPS